MNIVDTIPSMENWRGGKGVIYLYSNYYWTFFTYQISNRANTTVLRNKNEQKKVIATNGGCFETKSFFFPRDYTPRLNSVFTIFSRNVSIRWYFKQSRPVFIRVHSGARYVSRSHNPIDGLREKAGTRFAFSVSSAAMHRRARTRSIDILLVNSTSGGAARDKTLSIIQHARTSNLHRHGYTEFGKKIWKMGPPRSRVLFVRRLESIGKLTANRNDIWVSFVHCLL